MLFLRGQGSNLYRQWSRGYARFLCDFMNGPHRLLVSVRCKLGKRPFEEWALLDTGAEYSIIRPDLASLLGADLGQHRGTTTLSSRFGTVDAELRELDVILVADTGCGDDAPVPAVCALPSLWSGPPVILGFRGFLERLHIALDPGQDPHADSMFFFGAP